MKVRQIKAKEKVNERNITLRQDKRMNNYLEKISKEHVHVEQWQVNFKKQQMRENIHESLRLREKTDKELAKDIVHKAAVLNN